MKGNGAEVVINLIYYCWLYGEELYNCHQVIDGALLKDITALRPCRHSTIMGSFSYTLVSTQVSAFFV